MNFAFLLSFIGESTYFLVKSQIGNILSFEEHLVCFNYSTLPIAWEQPQPTHKQGVDVLPLICIYKTDGGQIWSVGHNLLTPCYSLKKGVHLWASPGGSHDPAAPCLLGGSSPLLPTVLSVRSTFPLCPDEVILVCFQDTTPWPVLSLATWFGVAHADK